VTVFSAVVTEDPLTFTDVSAKSATRAKTDSFGVADAAGRLQASVARAEMATVSEAWERVGFYVRAFAESVGLTETLLGLEVTARRLESIKVLDLLVGAAEAVISYLTVLNKGSREEDMLKLFDHGPLGFSRFRRFYPGTLKFSSMLVRTVLRTRDKNTVPRIQALTTTIDVADKRQQGSASVLLGESDGTLSDGKTITFSAPFYSPPEVVVMWKGGSGPNQGRAELVPGSTTATEFRVKVFDVVTNAPIAGDITYAVLGY